MKGYELTVRLMRNYPVSKETVHQFPCYIQAVYWNSVRIDDRKNVTVFASLKFSESDEHTCCIIIQLSQLNFKIK